MSERSRCGAVQIFDVASEPFAEIARVESLLLWRRARRRTFCGDCARRIALAVAPCEFSTWPATTSNTSWTITRKQSTSPKQLQHDNVHKDLSTILDSTTRSMGGKSLRHPLRRLHKLRPPLGKRLRASNVRIWRNTTLPSTATQETSKGRPNAEMHLAWKSFRNRGKLRRNRTRRTKSKKRPETTTGLQIRPRVVKQSFRRTLGATTEHLQPIIRDTVGHATPSNRQKRNDLHKTLDNRRT